MSASKPHVPALDGVRGLAVLLVVWYHARLLGGDAGEASALAAAYHRVRGAGWAGVDLFFVLSGFLITGILARQTGREDYYRDFVRRRALRLLPLYVLFVAGVLAVAAMYGGTADGARLLGNAPWLALHGANLLEARAGFASLPFASHLWSLAVEEQFYLMWPLVVLLVPARALGRVCLAVAGASLALRVGAHAAGVGPVALYVITPFRLDGLALGGWLAVQWQTEAGRERAVRALQLAAPVALLAVGAIVAVEHRYRLSLPGVRTVGYSANAVLAAALLVAALRVPRVRAVFESALLRRFGAYSYAIYLLHAPLVEFVTRADVVARAPAVARFGLAAELGYVLGVAAVCLGLGHLSYIGIERHFLARKDRAAGRAGGVRAGATPFDVAERLKREREDRRAVDAA